MYKGQITAFIVLAIFCFSCQDSFDDLVINENQESTTRQSNPNEDQSVKIECESCHGDASNYLNDPNLELVVHQPENSEHISTLQNFADTHTKAQASAKKVDKDLLLDYIEENL